MNLDPGVALDAANQLQNASKRLRDLFHGQHLTIEQRKKKFSEAKALVHAALARIEHTEIEQ